MRDRRESEQVLLCHRTTPPHLLLLHAPPLSSCPSGASLRVRPCYAQARPQCRKTTHGAAAPHAHTTAFEHSPHAPVSRLPANTAHRSSTPSSDSFVVAVCVCRRRVRCPLCQTCTTLRSWNPSPLHPRRPPTATVLYLSRHIPQSPTYLIIFCTRKIFQPFCCSPMRPHPPLRRRAASPSTRPLSS